MDCLCITKTGNSVVNRIKVRGLAGLVLSEDGWLVENIAVVAWSTADEIGDDDIVMFIACSSISLLSSVELLSVDETGDDDLLMFVICSSISLLSSVVTLNPCHDGDVVSSSNCDIVAFSISRSSEALLTLTVVVPLSSVSSDVIIMSS